MTRVPFGQVDTVIVGNGPSALILSYILHGNIPVYDLESPHPDPILHKKLKDCKDLLTGDVDFLTQHFNAARFSYSTQALPINVLLDTLIRPLGETDDVEKKTCIKWQYDPSRITAHVVVGNTSETGGQWADNPVQASWDIGTLSYAGMLSLPGYTFDDYYQQRYGQPLPVYLRPSRRQIAEYLAMYPEKVGIQDSIYNGQTLSGVSRTATGFRIASHDIDCAHLVLASGVFTKLIEPRPLLLPLVGLDSPTQSFSHSKQPILVIGSGFTAADVIISAPADQKIIHIYKWAPSKSPSPLRACHQQAYPEYAGVYRRMKLAALPMHKHQERRPKAQRINSSQFDLSRDWNTIYEGLPNTAIIDVEIEPNGATVTLQHGEDEPFKRRISSMSYLVGRRGSLSYLESDLRREICPYDEQAQCMSGHTLRGAASENLEVAKNVFIIGSLTGDSLVRFAYGGCVYAAGQILAQRAQKSFVVDEVETACSCKISLRQSHAYVPIMNGLDGHDSQSCGIWPSIDRRKSSVGIDTL